MFLFFCFFFVSGFCSLVYQVVWLRVAMAAFGVTTPLVSIVLSIFMAGLALGSGAGGKLVRRFEHRSGAYFIRLYGACELAIGVSGLIAAPLLRYGRTLLTLQGAESAWGSSSYYMASAAWVAVVLLPFCACMGATIPLAMAGIRRAFPDRSATSFSFLYLANLLGALAGTLISAFVLIELIGFSRTLLVAAAANGLVALGAAAFARARGGIAQASSSPRVEPGGTKIARDGTILGLLLATGLSSLGMEVVWTRQFVPFLGPVVYTFATILAVYLAASALGSHVYRWRRVRGRSASVWMYVALLAGVCSLLALTAADPRVELPPGLISRALRAVWGIGPFCAVLGFLTSMLIDAWTSGDPGLAGRAYAVNTVGCILGPLLAGFVFLPVLGERWTLVVLAIPFFAFPLAAAWNRQSAGLHPAWTIAAAVAVSIGIVSFTEDFEKHFPGSLVRRDHTATVIATGQGMNRQLLVNGVGITNLTPITKMMVHLPAASLPAPPEKVLVLCFGMGTSFRSALSWGGSVEAVDLVPSVPQLFGYFHSDGPGLARLPRATIVIDDARRFLERSRETFDLIVIDPPPPVAAAGSSLLYSSEFYATLAPHLRAGGILQQWLPAAETFVISAVTRSLKGQFADVRAFPSVETWGIHYLASQTAVPKLTASELAARLPEAATRDLLEWGPEKSAEAQFARVVDREFMTDQLMDPQAPSLTDDRPVNEYFLLRRLRSGQRLAAGP